MKRPSLPTFGAKSAARLELKKQGRALATALLLTSATTAVLTHSANADSQKLGRLPDGRAYRTDGSGYRLIDHVAELELQIEDLQKQVTALENEVSQKQTKIASLEKGRCSATLQETTLVGGGGRATPTQQDVKAKAERDAALQQLAQLESKILEQEEEFQKKSQLLKEREEELVRQGDELAQLKSSQEEQVAKAATTPRTVWSAGDQRARLTETRALSSEVPPTSGNVLTNTAPLKSALREIDQLIVARKNLIDALKEAKKGVSVPVQSLVSRTGLSLDTIRLRLSQLQPTEVAPVQVGLADIKAVLEEDIRVMQRLKGL